MKLGELNIFLSHYHIFLNGALLFILINRPSLFDDFVEYEISRLKNLETVEDQEGKNEENNNNNNEQLDKN